MNKKNNSFLEKYSSAIFWICFALVMAYSIVNSFYDIGIAPIIDWDEARHGVSAFEMMENKNYLVNTYLGEVDYWNLKPPFSFLFVILGYKIFGVNAFGMRFFSALSLPIICLITMIMMKNKFGKISSITSGILFANLAGRFGHLFLSGDPDAIFFLFYFLCAIFLYKGFVDNDIFFIFSGIFFSLAFLTKASHVITIAIVIFFSSIFLRKEKKFNLKGMSLFFIAGLIPTLIWVILRFNFDGVTFFKNMIEIDILNRTSSALEGHNHELSFYFTVTFSKLKIFLCLAFIFGILFNLIYIYKIKQNGLKLSYKFKAFIFIFMSIAITPFFIFSLSKTKLIWYIYPAMIGLVMICSFTLQQLFEKEKKIDFSGLFDILAFALSTLIICGVIIQPDRKLAHYYNDSSTIYPNESIFYDIDYIKEFESNEVRKKYITVNSNGDQSTLSQSWILDGIYNNFIFQKGDINILKEDVPENLYVILVYSNQDELNSFLNNYQYLTLITSNETSAIFKINL